MKYIMMITILALLTGCTVGGSVSDEDINKTVYCVDTRDNSYFKFKAVNVTNVRASMDGTQVSFEVIDTNGTKHYITKLSETYLKCTKD